MQRLLIIGLLLSGAALTAVSLLSEEPARQVVDNASADFPKPGRSLYEGFTGYTRQVTTNSTAAQQWFDQGIQLLYGFNHDEAIRSFETAAELDPSCAMAWWGSAYARGLHIKQSRDGRGAKSPGPRVSR
jgi:hypothetical protein